MMSAYKTLIAVVLSGFMSACVTPLVSAKSKPLSPSELNANSSKYNGQTVVVRGYLTLVPEGHNIYESSELDAEFRKRWDAGDKSFHPADYDKYCLTIANPQLLYENRAALSGKTLVVKGKFIDNYLDAHTLDLGACPLPTAIIIDEADLMQRYPSIKDSATRTP